MVINVKMPTAVGILTVLRKINFMLSQVEYDKSFVALGSLFCYAVRCVHSSIAIILMRKKELFINASSLRLWHFLVILTFHSR